MAVTPYKESTSKTEQVTRMFDNIAPSYDKLNHLLSAGIDVYWRRRAITALKPYKPKHILDIATGTGDFAFAALRLRPERILGLDISNNMIAIAREKKEKKQPNVKVEFDIANSENLPLEDNSFDAVTVGFGVRNFADIEQGMSEIYRVMRPGSVCAVLEPATPEIFPFKQLFNFYFTKVLPFIGKLVSKDKRAYTYLPESVEAFPHGQPFLDICSKVGFSKVKRVNLTLGICAMYLAEKGKPNFSQVDSISGPG